MSDISPLYAKSINRTLGQTKEIIKRCFKTNNIPMIWGPSGIGKTEMIEDLVASIPNCMQITLSLGSRDPLDFTGIPSLEGGRTITNDPTLVPLEHDPLPDNIRSVVVYIDELPEGDTPTLKAIYRLLNERMVNNSKIHPNVRFVASGNPGSAGALTEELIPTVANRMMHVMVNLCHKEWIGWATNKGISPVQRAFIADNPQMLSTYDPESNEDAFATPRTHARLHAFMDGDLFTSDSLLTKGAPVQFLGTKAGLALLDFAEATDLPPLADILADPEGFDIDALRPGSMFLLGQSLVSHAEASNIEKVLQVMARMQDNHKAVNFMSLTNLPPAKLSGLIQSPAFMKFVAEGEKLLSIISGVK